ncbi:DUF943 family protein [Paramixta manurensis]|uniref:DUF943 family protein n=1 Tax=Paramixta manurensis TaxID=2740817 RepID=A0A6M8UTW6_9GAMM|nr:DUF943 family protein [Erwiniaceae bacterium PD-1]
MKKHLVIAILILISAGASWVGYQKMHPTTIVAIHKDTDDNDFTDVLIKNPPFTDKGKLAWWKANQEMFKEKYAVPTPRPDGRFSIYIWDFSDGYKEVEKYDRLCFNDMKTSKNCIDKNWLMTISKSRNGKIKYDVDETSYIEQNGGFIKQKD